CGSTPGAAAFLCSSVCAVRSDLLQHIGAPAQADLFGLLQGGLPLDVGVGVLEVVVVAAPAGAGQVLAQLAVGEGRGRQAGVGAGLVQGHRVKRGEHPNIRQDGGVVLAVAVAVGADILHQADVEAGPAGADRRGILGHLAVQLLVGAAVDGVDGVKAACADAPAAALAQVVVDHGLVLGVVVDGVRAALFGAAAAAPAQLPLDGGLARGMLLHLAGPAAAAHADVLDSAAKSGGLVALEVGQADQDIGVHNGPADLGRLAVFPVGHGDLHLVGAPQAVPDQDLAAGG